MRGVRSSWVMLARKSDFARFAASAASFARCSLWAVSSRSLKSRIVPTKIASPAWCASPTESCMGKVEPSLRRPSTVRPTPITRRSPVRR